MYTQGATTHRAQGRTRALGMQLNRTEGAVPPFNQPLPEPPDNDFLIMNQRPDLTREREADELRGRIALWP